jgi:hypothetical protein
MNGMFKVKMAMLTCGYKLPDLTATDAKIKSLVNKDKNSKLTTMAL